jgi:MFS transporter, SP family, arabinose:H+ symporter
VSTPALPRTTPIEKLPEQGSTLYVYMVAIVAAMAGLLFGFDIAVINGAIIFIRDQFLLNEVQTEVATSSLLFGCIVGASVAGWLSDRYGRRHILILSAVLFAVSALGAALPRTMVEFTVARFIGGIAVGVASMLAPLYIAEVSPPHLRGRLVSLDQMAIVTGILVAYFVNWQLAFIGPAGWRYMFAAAAVPSVLLFVALFFVPESPRWLTEMGREREALRVLAKLNGRAVAESTLQEIKETIATETGTLRELFEPGLRRATMIAVALAILQQITGINVVLFYGSVIFKEHVGNSTDTAAVGYNVLIGLVNFFATIVALWIIDKAGRRPLLMFSAGTMAVCQLALGIAFLSPNPPAMLVLSIMLLLAASFAVGMGPGVWVVLAEIFPTRIRGRAMSIATISLWVACTALTMTFLSLVSAIGSTATFAIYSSMCLVTLLLVAKWLPETKGKTLEQIEKLWKK